MNIFRYFVVIAIFLTSLISLAQDESFYNNSFNFKFNYSTPDKYILDEITVSGTRFLDPAAIISITGLKIGDEIKLPGDAISNAMKKMWDQGILGDIQVRITKLEGTHVSLDFFLVERPRLSKFDFKGIKKSEKDDLKEKIKLIKGKVVTDAMVKNTQNIIKKYYDEKGFINADIKITQQKDTIHANSLVLSINITKYKKVKIKTVSIEGNNSFTDKKLRRKLKKTKQMAKGKFWQQSKYLPKQYEEDKKKLIDFYNKEGYRDIEIVHDTITYEMFTGKKADKKNKRYVNIGMSINEGKKYYFRNITWKGNNIYSSRRLSEILAIKKGDVYNGQVLESKLNFNPTGVDISSLYLDDGYLFFTVDPVEVLVIGDSIDIEMRIHEGPQATIDKVTLSGNTKTNDHVIYRELRTMPGQKFSRANLIRSQREIAQLGYFDAEKIEINPIPNPQKGTVDIHYGVTEKPSDQLQLSGGWGGFFGFVGTVGLVFNNFSARNIRHFKKWDPLPSGDGQRFSVNVQANGQFYQNYSMSFTEPWLGGRKPNALTISLNRAVQRSGNNTSLFGVSNNASLFRLNSVSLNLGKRLRWPDDYFTINYTANYLLYELKNYPLGSINVPEGKFNNFNFAIGISRNSIDQPMYPRRGSSISLSTAFTPPYSAFKKDVDYDKLAFTEKFNFVEYHKWMFDGSWFVKLVGNLVLNTRTHLGFLGSYNPSIKSPFERFSLGGSGMTGFSGSFLLGTDFIGLRGYQDGKVGQLAEPSKQADNGVAFVKYVTELRFPISLNPAATIYVVGFAEAGNAYRDMKQYDPFNVYRSTGVGARIFMPAFGLIGVDYGWAMDDIKHVTNFGRNAFTFTIGQQIR